MGTEFFLCPGLGFVPSPAWVPIHFLPSVGVNNNDIQLALCNYLLTQQGPALIGSSKTCTCVCVWWECEMSHWRSSPFAPLESNVFGEWGMAQRVFGGPTELICFHIHCCLLTLTEMCLPVDYYQLFIPSGPGRATMFVRCSEAGVSAQLARYSPPPRISHCPPSNEKSTLR